MTTTTFLLAPHATWTRTDQAVTRHTPADYRAWLTGFLRLFGYVGDDAELVLSEVVTNAVVHAEPPLHCHASLDDDRLTVELTDRPAPHAEPTAELDDLDALLGALPEHGRGLLICAELCQRIEEHTDPDTGRHTVTVVIDLRSTP